MTRATLPKWSTEPLVEQLARLGAGFQGGWPDEATRAIVMGAVNAASAHYRHKWESAARALALCRAAERERLKSPSDARAKAP